MPEARFSAFCERHGLGDLVDNKNTPIENFLLFDQLLSLYRESLENMCMEFPRLGNATAVEFGFCVNSDLNSFAIEVENSHYLIGMNTGIVPKLVDLYDDIFSGSPKFPEAAGVVAMFTALAFLFFHEIGHIVLGHPALLKTLRAQQASELRAAPSDTEVAHMLMEANSHRQGQNSKIVEIFQCAEIHADIWAVARILRSISRGEFIVRNIENVISDRSELIRVIGIAIFVMFCLFFEPETSVEYWPISSHPHPAIRIMEFWHQVIELTDPGQEYSNLIIQTRMDVEEFSLSSRFSELFEHKDRIHDELMRITENRQRFDKQLRQFWDEPMARVRSFGNDH